MIGLVSRDWLIVKEYHEDKSRDWLIVLVSRDWLIVKEYHENKSRDWLIVLVHKHTSLNDLFVA